MVKVTTLANALTLTNELTNKVFSREEADTCEEREAEVVHAQEDPAGDQDLAGVDFMMEVVSTGVDITADMLMTTDSMLTRWDRYYNSNNNCNFNSNNNINQPHLSPTHPTNLVQWKLIPWKLKIVMDQQMHQQRYSTTQLDLKRRE